MFRIYTKERDSKELFSVNLTATEVKELMGNNLFLDYPEIDKNSCIIVEQEEAFKYPTYSEGMIREKTKEELVAEGVEVTLEAGEKIENKKLIKVEQPSQYHQWNGTEWTVDLDEVKNIKREELKLIRDKLCKEDLNVNGSLFQVRNTEDTGKFERIILGLLLKTISPEQTEEWRLADNSYKTFTYGELSQIPKLYSDREREIFAKFKELDEKLEELNTADEIMALKWV